MGVQLIARAALALIVACHSETSQLGTPQIGKQYHCTLVDDETHVDDVECLTDPHARTDLWTRACGARHADAGGTWVCSADCTAVDDGRDLCLITTITDATVAPSP